MNDRVSFGNAAGQDRLLAYLVHAMGITASLVNLGELVFGTPIGMRYCLNIV